jgi:hypothetical protein
MSLLTLLSNTNINSCVWLHLSVLVILSTQRRCLTWKLMWYNFKQDRQCKCNVTMRRFRVTIVAMENNKFYIFCVCVCVCSLRYPACKAHAPYCHLWPARLYNIFPPNLINCTIFEKKNFIGHKKFVFIFSTDFVRNISHFKNNSSRYYHKCMYVLMYSTCYSCQVLRKLVFSRHILEKSSNIEINGNPSSGSRVDPWGRPDRHDEANTRFSQFCDSA